MSIALAGGDVLRRSCRPTTTMLPPLYANLTDTSGCGYMIDTTIFTDTLMLVTIVMQAIAEIVMNCSAVNRVI